MKHRIFIAINLPEEIKNELMKYQERWPDLPAKWTKKENLHITLEFLGCLTDEEIVEACERTREIALTKKRFNVNLNKICYALTKKNNNKVPRMVWVVGEKIKEFNVIPHITLARIKTWSFKQFDIDQRPIIDQDIFPPAGGLKFTVNSIQVMESYLKKNGPEYHILENCLLNN